MPPSRESRIRGVLAGVIESGAMSRATNSEFWAEIRAAVSEAGLDWDRGAGDVARSLRSDAIARRNSYQRFQRARPEQTFDASLRAPDLNVRPLTVQAVQPEFLVRTDVKFLNVLGEEEHKTVSSKHTLRPGMTVAQVLDEVHQAVERMNRAENGTLYGIILAVENLRPVTI